MRKWQDWANLVLGLWLVLSPWILGFSGTSSATWNAVILGLLVGLLALSVAREKPKDRKSTRLNSSHLKLSRMPSSA